MSRRALLAATCVAGVLTAGVVVAQSQQDTRPAPNDPIADILRNAPPVEPVPADQAPVPPAPVATPAPGQTPTITVAPPAPSTPTETVETADADDEAEAEEAAPVAVAEKAEVTPVAPGRRQRRPVAIVQAIDKITAESMRFEVEVGGPPVRFNQSLIFTARACEVSAPDEPVDDSVAYLEVSVQPRGVTKDSGPRQIFRGWMFASTPGISGIQHPIYDAWVVGCKA